MRDWIIYYEPMWSQFSRLSKVVKANSEEQAKMKFYCSKEGDNCQSIIDIQPC